MTTTSATTPVVATGPIVTTSRRPRDARLDFFRGLAMFIILIAHIPWNVWALWIPARFGFSDATEIFVFCSGMASALAFGSIFRNRSWFLGAARIIQRIWQIYWSHIGVFLMVFAIVLIADGLIDGGRYVGKLNLFPLLERPAENLLGLLTLTYVPNYFDMLPMYIGILALVPIVAGLGRFNPMYAGAFVVALWLAATTGQISLPAEPWTDRSWFFNPFAWQLVFFTGFAFASGWLKPPKPNRRWIAFAVVVLIITIPFAWYMTLRAVPDLRDIHTALHPVISKTNFGLFRYLHFLAIAYLAYCAVGEGGRRLATSGIWGRVVDIIRLVGQQSLAVFVSSLALAQTLGVVLDQIGRNPLNFALVNIFGFSCLIGIAAAVSWYKSEPWRKPAKQAAPKVSETASLAAGPALTAAAVHNKAVS